MNMNLNVGQLAMRNNLKIVEKTTIIPITKVFQKSLAAQH